MIQVQIVDGHKLFVEGLARIINDSDFAKVIGTAYSVSECWEMFSHSLTADVLLLDVLLPDGNGMDLCLQIKAKYPDMKILALTGSSEYTVITRMLENGALGYILKSAGVKEFFQGIKTVAAGDSFLCEEIKTQLRKQEGTVVLLTKKERELLRLICEGYTSMEIADKMFFGVETINSYRKNLLCKLDARNTASLVKMAIEKKLL
jgi:DNA-binding NarL/FixJ family response regulator